LPGLQAIQAALGRNGRIDRLLRQFPTAAARKPIAAIAQENRPIPRAELDRVPVELNSTSPSQHHEFKARHSSIDRRQLQRRLLDVLPIPEVMHEARRKKLADARHRRREQNLKLRQPTLPLEDRPALI
jgi:hypothetical protein